MNANQTNPENGLKKYSIDNLAMEIRTLSDVCSILAEFGANCSPVLRDVERMSAALDMLYTRIREIETIANVLDGYDNPPETCGRETLARRF